MYFIASRRNHQCTIFDLQCSYIPSIDEEVLVFSPLENIIKAYNIVSLYYLKSVRCELGFEEFNEASLEYRFFEIFLIEDKTS